MGTCKVNRVAPRPLRRVLQHLALRVQEAQPGASYLLVPPASEGSENSNGLNYREVITSGVNPARRGVKGRAKNV